MRGDAGLLARGVGGEGAEAVDLDADRVGGGGVALGELVAEIVEGGVGGAPERDRLLDLEVERDAPVLDAAAVLDRHERDEAQQLLGAAGRLLGGERGGGEAVERLVDLAARVGGGLLVAGLGGVAERTERRGGCGRGGRAAVLLVAGGEDVPVAGGLRCGLGLARREALAARGVGVLEQLALACLVGVEQVLGDRDAGGSRRELALTEPGDGGGRVCARAREARGGAEVAQQQPRAGGGGVAAARAVERDRVGAGEQRGLHLAARGGQRAAIAAPRGPLGDAQRAPQRPVGRRGVRPQRAPQDAAIRRAGTPDVALHLRPACRGSGPPVRRRARAGRARRSPTACSGLRPGPGPRRRAPRPRRRWPSRASCVF